MTSGSGHPIPGAQPGGSGADVHADLLERLRRATLGEYDVHSELGRGGMATVFLAHEIALDRKVAIKVMSPALLYGGTAMVERFRREARTAASLSHPNIIPVYSVREAEGLLYFVMKLVQGTPLDSVIRELGPLPLPMVEAILTQVGGAFGYAHRHGVIHRDIKPANILIDEEGWAVVTDFGIAKVTDTDGLTLTGMSVGTPTYMSPEQCSGATLTGASDQYSLGVVAYEMLTGRPPFLEAGLMAVLLAHATKEAPPIAELRPDCPESLRRVVERMLAKDPAERWPTLEDAVATIGIRTLAHDDPHRSTLVQLARSGITRKLVAQARTPFSPSPVNRDEPAQANAAQLTRRRRSRLAAAFLAGGIAVAGALALALWPRDERALADSDLPGVTIPDSSAAAAGAGPPPVAPGDPPPPPQVESRSAPERPAGRTERGVSSAPRGPATGSQPTGAGVRTAPDTQPATLPAVPAPIPTVVAPPPAAAETVRARTDTPAPVAPPPSDQVAIESVIQAYARALETGRVEEVVRHFPGLPALRRRDLESFYRDGGSYQLRLQVSDIVVSGATATVRIQGTNVVRTARTRPTEQRVDWRARLERGPAGWRLVALVG